MKAGHETSLVLPVTSEFIERRIYLIRARKVMMDSVLAELYRVETGNLIKAVKRNIDRFPEDFMFQLSKNEANDLRFQNGISRWGGRRYLPYVFTELGVAMLSSVLKSKQAIQMNVFIMRAFVKLRELLATNKELAQKIEELEARQKEHTNTLIIISIALNKLQNDHKKLDKRVKKAHRPLKSAIGFEI